MQGTAFVNYIRDFHRQLLDRGLINGTPHVLVLDGHASHVTYEVVKLARDLNIVLYQIPSHSSHVVQPLDVVSFGSFKREITKLLDRGLINGTPHVLVLDGHASHVTYEVVKLARDLNIVLYQIPSHSSHVVQPLDVVSFGSFKREITKVLSAFPARNGGRVPAKSDMLGILGDAWLRSFSEEQNISSFAGAGLWPVDGERAMGRLQDVGKRKQRSGARPPVEDITVAISD
ncbi:unnamed protein product [Ectocarpus sp. CCAP 1310/34]|nr:unnamed protein product [Ectocarpus sp. CCAP 1310/34]